MSNSLREALSAALEQVNKVYDILSRPCVVIEEARQGCREARGVLIPALSEPPRNCEVGSPEEQAQRFDSFCVSHYTPPNKDGVVPDGCDCPCYVRGKGKGCNAFVWAQMPYEADKKGGEDGNK